MGLGKMRERHEIERLTRQLDVLGDSGLNYCLSCQEVIDDDALEHNHGEHPVIFSPVPGEVPDQFEGAVKVMKWILEG